MKIVVFTGAGISRESGIPTFRDSDGVYSDKEIEEMVTYENFVKNPQPYYEWINSRKEEYGNCEPNDAHKYFGDLEAAGHEVTIITQNVDDLHEKGGSKNVLHLHGEINKVRYVLDHGPKPKLIEHPGPLSFYDAFTEEGQLRPHIVLFGEMPYNTSEAYNALQEAELLVIIGTSLNITYTEQMLLVADMKGVDVVYLDPKPVHISDKFRFANFSYLIDSATEGVKQIEEKYKFLTK